MRRAQHWDSHPVAAAGFFLLAVVRFAQLIAAFGVATLLLIGIGLRDTPERRVSLGLIAATWFSLLAPLSWFVIFKAHSHIHVGMNQIAWHMPYVLFGFAIVGRVCGSIGRVLATPRAR